MKHTLKVRSMKNTLKETYNVLNQCTLNVLNIFFVLKKL